MSEQGEKNLLAGHAPATIVGGMRVSKPSHPHSNDINNNNNKSQEKAVDESVDQEQLYVA